jgi:tetratricopeptide (TPR) repeat protein
MSDSWVAELLQEGIAAAKAGQKEEAQRALAQVVELDERNEQAWLWLSGVVESPEDKRTCLENVLSINPNNTHAQTGLRWLEQQAPAPPAVEDVPAPEERPALEEQPFLEEQPAPEEQPFVEEQPVPEEQPLLEEQPLPEEQPFLEEAVPEDQPPELDRCPHCSAPIPPSGTQCPYCSQPLIVTCPACGQYVDVKEASCPDCGQHLGDFREGAAYHLSLAQAYLDGRRLDQALASIGHAEADAPDDPQVLETAATLYQKAGRTDLAIAATKQALEHAPDAANLYARLGALHRLASQPDQARDMYEKAVQLTGNDPSSLTELARLQIEAEGATEETAQLLRKAIKADQQYVPAHLLLGDLCASQQDRQQAFKHYRLASQYSPPGSEASLEAGRKMTGLQRSSQQRAQVMQKGADRPVVSEPRRRPGCLTLFAIPVALAGVGGILVAILYGALLAFGGDLINDLVGGLVEQALPALTDNLPLVLWGGVGVTLVIGILYLAIANGLWNLKNWARIIVIILSILGILGGLAQAAATILSLDDLSAALGPEGFSTTFACFLLGWFVIQAIILIWFLANRKIFD